MVQVTCEPFEENQPILARTTSQHVLDELKTDQSHHVEEVAYKVVASSMMADPINITNPFVALDLLETSLKNRNVPVAKHCLAMLNENVRQDNTLKILLSIGRWINESDDDQPWWNNFEPSAPPLVDNDDDRNDNWMKEPLEQLRQLCLSEIDKNGDMVLKDKRILDMHYQDLLAIATSDTLLVSSEMVVYVAVMKWCREQCERKELTTETENLKVVLRDLAYAPRYGLMTKREFFNRVIDGIKGPDRIGILEEDETDQIVEYIRQKEKKKKDIKKLPYKMSQERRGEKSKKGNGDLKEKVIINCLTCWSVVFD